LLKVDAPVRLDRTQQETSAPGDPLAVSEAAKAAEAAEAAEAAKAFEVAEAARGMEKIRAAPMRPRTTRRLVRFAVLALVLWVGVVALGHWLLNRWSHVYVTDSRIAANVISLGSQVTGRVTAIAVLAGDRVSKGDLLVRLESRQAELRLQELDAEAVRILAEQNQLRAQQDMIRRQVKTRLEAGRTQIRAAEAGYRAVEAELEAARSDNQRHTSLRKAGAVSVQQFEEGQAKFVSTQQQALGAVAGIEAARAALLVIESEASQIEVLARHVLVLDAQRTALEARQAQQRIDLEDREVRAAFDGVIDATFIEVGEHVAPGTRLLMYHDPTAVWVDANVKETEFRKLKIGATASVTVDAYPGREFKAEVVRLGSAATSQFALLPSPNPSGNFTKVTQRLPVRMAIAQDAALLRPGMMVEVAIDVVD
jgi:membrane fusion protein (multidrug efflux system)